MTEPSELHRLTELTHALDDRLSKLSHAGIIGPHQPCTGEEAVLAGASYALAASDWVFWGKQVCVPALVRGVRMSALFTQALAPNRMKEDLAAQRIVNQTHGLATRVPHATGLAWAARHDNVAVLCELGDASVSDAEFHVGVNFAAVMNAPVVFLVRTERGSKSISARAEGYGLRSMNVDGMSAEAVRETVTSALDIARNGGGATLVEASVKRGAVVHQHAVHAYAEDIDTALAEAERYDDTVHGARG